MARAVPDGEGARRQVERHRRGLARLERDLAEALELPGRLARRRREADVDLAHLGAEASPGVGDREADARSVAARLGLEARVGEARVRQPEAEREQRLHARGVEPAVADPQALGVDGLAVLARVLLLRLERRVGDLLGEGLRQLARG